MFFALMVQEGSQKNNSSRGEVHEKNSRIHLDRLQNKYTNYKGINNNTLTDQYNDFVTPKDFEFPDDGFD